jgi:hypothetical protein
MARPCRAMSGTCGRVSEGSARQALPTRIKIRLGRAQRKVRELRVPYEVPMSSARFTLILFRPYRNMRRKLSRATCRISQPGRNARWATARTLPSGPSEDRVLEGVEDQGSAHFVASDQDSEVPGERPYRLLRSRRHPGSGAAGAHLRAPGQLLSGPP